MPLVGETSRERRKRGFGDAPMEGKRLFYAFKDLERVVHRDGVIQEHGNAPHCQRNRSTVRVAEIQGDLLILT